ncbi:MAG: PaaI family thioesterase, partial [Bacteroidetes bacterium]|nr:PaaI family thioesterase [Bacteroidota bacterium]
MDKNEHYKKLEEMYLSAPVQKIFPKTSISIGEATAEITLPITPVYFHAAAATHGSVYFRMLDDAAFFAASSLEFEFFILTADFELKFLRPVSKGILRSEGDAWIDSSGRLQARAGLYNEDGEAIA